MTDWTHAWAELAHELLDLMAEHEARLAELVARHHQELLAFYRLGWANGQSSQWTHEDVENAYRDGQADGFAQGVEFAHREQQDELGGAA